MEDFNALAAALGAGIADIRGCLILSRDGLVLGAYPGTAESQVKPAWLRFAAMGEPERGFVQFGTEVWSYVRRGPYAAFCLTGSGVRPGLAIDQMERVLLTAEEGRSKREGLEPAAPPAPATQTATRPQVPMSKKKRRGLHRESRPLEEPVVIHADPPAAVTEATQPAPTGAEAEAPAETASAVPEPPPSSEEEEPQDAPSGVWATGEEGEEVDRFSLAREFSQLLQDERDDADG